MLSYSIHDFLEDTRVFDERIYTSVLEYLSNNPANTLDEFLWSLSKNHAVTLSSVLHDVFHKNKKFYQYLPMYCYYDMNSQEGFDWFINYLLTSTISLSEQLSLYWTLLYCLNTNRNLNTNNNKTMLLEVYTKMYNESRHAIKFDNTVNEQNSTRIFIYITNYTNESHAPTKIANTWALAFEQLNYPVFIIICTPAFYPYPTSPLYRHYKFLETGTLQQLSPNIFLTEIGADPTSINAYQDFCSRLNLSNHDRYLLIGDSCLPFDILPFEHTYMIATNAYYSVSSAKHLIFHENLNLNNINNEPMHFLKGPFDYMQNAIKFDPPMVNDNSLINITIVSNRLDDECTNITWQALQQLTSQISNIRIFLVGKFSRLTIPPSLVPFIECVGYQNDLNRFFQNIHFYLKLEGNGGGQSAVIALKSGIPIITFPQGDVYSILHRQYCIYESEEIVTFIQSYMNDENFKAHIDLINKTIVQQMNTEFIISELAKQITA